MFLLRGRERLWDGFCVFVFASLPPPLLRAFPVQRTPLCECPGSHRGCAAGCPALVLAVTAGPGPGREAALERVETPAVSRGPWGLGPLAVVTAAHGLSGRDGRAGPRYPVKGSFHLRTGLNSV